MPTINRETLIKQLESVEPGLTEREVLEQSSCFIFQDGTVTTFNQNVACSHSCCLKITGAVRAKPLLDILRKLLEEELEIAFDNGTLRITGNKKECGIVSEKDIHLPIGSVEKPGKWHDLDEAFIEAIEIVRHCASKEESTFKLTCVHITPTHIEACDNTQASRVKVKTPVQRDILVRSEAVSHIVTLGMTQISETESWVHFRNPAGLVLSCQRFVEEDWVDVSSLMKQRGAPIVLPKGLGDAAEKAAIFASETTEAIKVQVELRPGKLRITGKGDGGYYKETRKIAYDGQPLAFTIAPQLLISICKKYTDAEVTVDSIRVNGGKWQYAACLDAIKEQEEKAA